MYSRAYHKAYSDELRKGTPVAAAKDHLIAGCLTSFVSVRSKEWILLVVVHRNDILEWFVAPDACHLQLWLSLQCDHYLKLVVLAVSLRHRRCHLLFIYRC